MALKTILSNTMDTDSSYSDSQEKKVKDIKFVNKINKSTARLYLSYNPHFKLFLPHRAQVVDLSESIVPGFRELTVSCPCNMGPNGERCGRMWRMPINKRYLIDEKTAITKNMIKIVDGKIMLMENAWSMIHIGLYLTVHRHVLRHTIQTLSYHISVDDPWPAKSEKELISFTIKSDVDEAKENLVRSFNKCDDFEPGSADKMIQLGISEFTKDRFIENKL